VDNFSIDRTEQIARQYGAVFVQYGPERSAQVNYGVRISSGSYVFKVDSDFVLQPSVVEACIAKAEEGFGAVVVHNTPDSSISLLAKIRKFEVDMYKYRLEHSSARFLRKETFVSIGGFSETITAGEDYDFQNRLNKRGVHTGFVDPEALHLGEPTILWPLLVKYFDYGMDFSNFLSTNPDSGKHQIGPWRREYLENWKMIVTHPAMSTLLGGYLILKYSAGISGFLYGKFYRKWSILKAPNA
jgi:glycosyltransferase involved in cell wall biosynthesis